jgi:DNA invertase Pin-like site-specific DNA recombinase
MRCAAYYRFSSAGQKDLSIQHQRTMCRQFCERAGWELVKEFEDRAKSAWSGKDRAGLNSLLSHAKDHLEAGVVLVYDLDRFSRDFATGYADILALTSAGVSIADTTHGILDQTDVAGAVMAVLSLFRGQQESDVKSRRVKAAHKAIREAGGWIGKPPYGYRHVKADRGGLLEIEPGEAKVVRMVYRMADRAQTTTKIAKKLADSGIRTRSGTVWRACNIHAMLTSPTYAGMIPPGRKGYSPGRGLHKPVVAPELWARVQGRFGNKNPSSRRSRGLPLSGLLICGECGAQMVKASAGRIPSLDMYRCRDRVNCKICINSTGVSVAKATAVIHDLLRSLRSIPVRLEGAAGTRAGVDDLIAARANLDGLRANLISALESGAESASIVARIVDLDGQISSLDAKIAQPAPAPMDLASVIDKILTSDSLPDTTRDVVSSITVWLDKDKPWRIETPYGIAEIKAPAVFKS